MVGRRRTTVRSIRIDDNVDRVLKEDAESIGISVNSLISMILTKYIKWDRLASRYGFVSITKEELRSILNSVDRDKLAVAAEELGSEIPKSLMLFWFKEYNLDVFLQYLSMICSFGGVAEYEVNVSGYIYTLAIHHDLGRNYSEYLARFFGKTLKSIIKADPEVMVNGNEVVLKFDIHRLYNKNLS
jgi:antitoxin component of RelBE/YafQ-DinJ toxin-antitoxin module